MSLSALVDVLTGWLDPAQRRRLRRLLRRPRWGGLRRLQPISGKFGFDRGTPVDRHYTDAFLAVHADAVRGVVGEIAGDIYARRFGGNAIERIDVIDNDPSNQAATLIADLGQADALPTAAFDCLIVTQTLQYLAEPATALRGCSRALRPGGALLVAVPALAAHDPIEPDAIDFWRFWPTGLQHLLATVFPHAVIKVHGFGNLVTAIAFLHGVSAEELRPRELAAQDPRFPVVVLARVDVGPGHQA